MKPLFPALAAALLLPACAPKKETEAKPPPNPTRLFSFLQPKKKPKTPEATPVDWTGEIRMVNAPGNFVLVESTSATPPVPGAKYLAMRGAAEAAVLRMTSLRNHPFFIADIASGEPAAGDRIYLPAPTAKPQATPQPTEKTNPAPPPAETLPPPAEPEVTTRPQLPAAQEPPLPLPE
jgi:hypothetical protein